MDKKKLIGTIIGVVAFAALIAGATYAYLSSAVNVTAGTGVYNAKSMHFLVDYTKGTDISDIPLLANPTADKAKVLTVQAGLASGSTPGKMTIYLNTTSSSNALITGGYIKYSYCIGTCSGTTFATNTKALTSTNQIAIISDTALSTTKQNYNIYFWIDDKKDLSTVAGLSYAGNISAIATQTE